MDWLGCPECHKHNFYYRKLTDDYLCRICGTIFIANFGLKLTMKKKVNNDTKDENNSQKRF